MNKILLSSVLLLALYSCNNSSTETLDTAYDQEKVLQNILETHGVKSFDENTIHLKIENTKYTHRMMEGRPFLSQERIKDLQTHKATYYGGTVNYLIDGSLQDESTYPRMMLERSLYGFLQTYFIPFTLRTNDVKWSSLPEVTIRSAEYFVLQGQITNEIPLPPDTYILYIDKEKFTIDYLALRHPLTSNVNQFRRMINPRKINGVLFQDYIIFTPKDSTIPLEQLYEYFNKTDLKVIRTIALNEIEVDPN